MGARAEVRTSPAGKPGFLGSDLNVSQEVSQKLGSPVIGPGGQTSLGNGDGDADAAADGRLDLRGALWHRGEAGEFELAEEAVVLSLCMSN